MVLSTLATFLANTTVLAVSEPAVFGDIVIATMFAMVSSVIFRTGIDRMIIAEVAVARARGDTDGSRRVGSSLISASLALGTVGALLVVFGPLAWLLDISLSTPLTLFERCFVGLWLMADVSRLVAAEAHRSERRFRMAALSGYGLRAPLFLAILVTALLMFGSVNRSQILACAAAASSLVLVMALTAACTSFSWWRANPIWALRRTRRGNAAMLLTALAGALIGGADVWVVGAAFDPDETARYAFAATTVGGLAILSTAINGGLSPYIARAHAAGQLSEMQPLVLRYVRMSLLAALVLFAAILVLLEPLAERLGGASYDGLTPIVAILAAGQVASTAAGLSGYVLALARHYAAVASVTVIVAVLSVVSELAAGFLLAEILLVALAKAAATGLLPILNDRVASRLLGVRTHAFTARPWKE